MSRDQPNEIVGEVRCVLPFCLDTHALKLDKYKRPYFYCSSYNTNVFMNGPAGKRFLSALLSGEQIPSARESGSAASARELTRPGEMRQDDAVDRPLSPPQSEAEVRVELRDGRVVVTPRQDAVRPEGQVSGQTVQNTPHQDSPPPTDTRNEPSTRDVTFGREQDEAPNSLWPEVGGGVLGFFGSEVLYWAGDGGIDRLRIDANSRDKLKWILRLGVGASSVTGILVTAKQSSAGARAGRWIAFTSLFDTALKSWSLWASSRA